ncbi:outer membrane protein OmpA-like peptidoglycan-associated protein [Aquimarina sp. MAR_2010_214]|uniref:OmpA family protein n=1 Tax=Aquimarina sp. MAR_2010_214 TaxID=1250026 RepID=UPI000C701488|nr:OmpA family protein [Aquimarina sp. MAR_2010_214]PKV51314.1 outer membrane protein OmpA-like peptidoglycan-associated protein [Aquimarina sp. MAR_2010_214]
MKTNLKKMVVAVMAVTILTSCEAVKNSNKTQRGAVIGTAAGAVIGGIIGNNVKNKNSALGAVIGGVVGGVAGGVIGKQMDKQAQKIESEIPGAEVTRVGEGIDVVFDENSGVYFATNKSDINSKSKANLKKLAGIFKEYPDTNIIVEGHTDSTGDDSYNMALSQRRANAVTNYLVSQGISKSRLTTYAHGETLPKYDNATPAGRAKNRRVELGIVANDKMKQDAQKQVKQ